MPALLIALVLLGGTACAAARPRSEPPVVEVVAVGGVLSRGALVLELDLLVHNPDERPLRARALDWEVSAGGRPQARGRADVDAVVPAGRTVALAVRCLVGPGASARLVPLLAGGVLALEGVLHLDAAHGRVAWRGPLAIR